MKGCLKWQASGLAAPKSIGDATNQYRETEDSVSCFIRDRCICKPDAKARARALYDAFCEYTNRSGNDNMSQKRFGTALTEMGYEAKKRDGRTWRIGIELRTSSG
ncbi:hypothetical protein LCGC14_2324040 [marine sediment metagenome]|uniref:DNA primase/nucleoside triphosphatase C-terminal domain-containing protein n=1 Tax=marine sediment metagenome TaxID=412755 RepID=A0A0F9EUD3_9ZZZZ